MSLFANLPPWAVVALAWLTSSTVLAITSAFLGGVTTIMARLVLQKMRPQEVMVISFVVMMSVLLILSPHFYVYKPSLESALVIVALCLIDTVANLLLFKAHANAEPGVSSPLLALTPFFTFLFGWVLMGDRPDIPSAALSFAIVMVLILLSIDLSRWRQISGTVILPALLSGVLFGLSAIPAKHLLSTMDAINAPTLYMFRSAYIALFSLIFLDLKLSGVTQKEFRLILVRSLLVIAQWLCFYLALQKGEAGITVTLANLTPVFVFILAPFFLKERTIFKTLLARDRFRWSSPKKIAESSANDF